MTTVAQGIAEYGEVFAAWAAYVGPENDDQLARSEDHYRGAWESVQSYVEDLLDNIGFNYDLEQALRVIPKDLRIYVTVDVEALARDWEVELHVVERRAGGVWLFEVA